MLLKRPLPDVPFVKTVLGLNEDAVMDLVEEGFLPAFNVACSPTAHRREIRILGAGLTYYVALQRPLPVEPEALVNDIFPPDAIVTTTGLQASLNCSGELIRLLIASKALRLAPGGKPRRGRGGAGTVDRHSAIAFLKSRII